jgi:uncharacterized glyoxalase superfamily protein PhnB
MAKPDLVGMVVLDMPSTLSFYRMLGLEIAPEKDTEDHVEVVLPGGFRIAWDTLDMIKGLYPDWVEPNGQRLSLAFKCETPAALDDLHTRLVQSKYQSYKAPWDAFWGQRYAVVIDPDGNHVDLFADR